MSSVFLTKKLDARIADDDLVTRDQVFDNVPKLGAKVAGTVYVPKKIRSIAGEKVTWKHKPVDPQPSNSFFHSTNPSMTIYLEQNDVNRIHEAYLEFNLTTANAAGFRGFPPIYHWLDRCEYWVRGGRQLQIVYPEDYMMWMASMSKDKRMRMHDYLRFDEYTTRSYSIIGFSDRGNSRLDLNEVFRLPLIGIFETEMIDMTRITHDIEIRLYFKDDYLDMPLKLSAAYTKSQLTLNSLTWAFKHSHTSSPSFYEGKSTRDHFLQSVIIRENQKTLTASTRVKFSLQQFDGLVPYLLFMVRQSLTPYGIQRFNPYSLGKGSRFDLLSPTNISLWGIGEHIKESEIQLLNRKHLGEFFHGMYYLPFCHSIKDARKGVLDGVHVFDGSSQFLSVDFGAEIVGPDSLSVVRPAVLPVGTIVRPIWTTADRKALDAETQLVEAETDVAVLERAVRSSHEGFASGLYDNFNVTVTAFGDGSFAMNASGPDRGKLEWLGELIEAGTLARYDGTFQTSEAWETGSAYETTIVAPMYHVMYINDIGEVYVEKMI